MSAISNYLVKIDRFCDILPFISSLTNLYYIFQKCVLLIQDKNIIKSSHFYTYIDQKSFLRCFMLVIPIIGNLIIGIYDFSRRAPIGNNQIYQSNISLDDVEKIDIRGECQESWPCRHQSTVFLKDGRKASGLSSYGICSIVSHIGSERINPTNPWKAEEVKGHFSAYSKPMKGWKVESPETVLNKSFSRQRW